MILKRTDSTNADFRHLVSQLDVFLAEIDGDEHDFYARFNGLAGIPNVIVAYDGDAAVGCGSFKPYSEAVCEIKRMFVLDEHRGRGIGALLLTELEKWAAQIGFQECILETGHRQTAAVALYTGAGYAVVPNYGQYADVGNSICMKKVLAASEEVSA